MICKKTRDSFNVFELTTGQCQHENICDCIKCPMSLINRIDFLLHEITELKALQLANLGYTSQEISEYWYEFFYSSFENQFYNGHTEFREFLSEYVKQGDEHAVQIMKDLISLNLDLKGVIL